MTTYSQTCSITSTQKQLLHTTFGKYAAALVGEIDILSGIANNSYSVAGGNIANILTYTATPFHSGATKSIAFATKLLASLSGSSNNLQPAVPGGNVGEIVTLNAQSIGLTKLINLMSSNFMASLTLGTKLVSAVTYLCSGEYLYANASKAGVLHPVNPSMTNSFIIKLARQISWAQQVLVSEIVSLSRKISKNIIDSISQFVTLQKQSNEVTLSFLSGEFLTLNKGAVKSFLTKIGEILSLTTIKAHMNFKTLTFTTGEIVTIATPKGINIYLLNNEVISLRRGISKIIVLGHYANLLDNNGNILTDDNGNPLTTDAIPGNPVVVTFSATKFVKSLIIKLLSGQLLTQTRTKTQVSRRPIKIIPLNFDYQFPFSYTQAPTNPIYVNDAATLFLTPSEPIAASQAVAMQITGPNGVSVTRYYPLVWISKIPSWSEAGDSQNLTTFAVTQFDPGELNQVGYWQVALIYNGISAQNGTFYVGPTP